MTILERHPVSGYELRHYRREPDDVLTRNVARPDLECVDAVGEVAAVEK